MTRANTSRSSCSETRANARGAQGSRARMPACLLASLLPCFLACLFVSFSSFFTSQNLEVSAAVHFPEDPNMQVKTLFPFMEDTALEVFEITLLNHHQQLSSAHQQGVIEHVYVVSGCLSVLADGEWKKIHEGESMRFYADQPHGYQGITDSVVFQNIIRYL